MQLLGLPTDAPAPGKTQSIQGEGLKRELDTKAKEPEAKRPQIAAPKVITAPHFHTPLGGVLENIDLMVCDMAGTTVQEGGIVYKTLQASMQKQGLTVSDAEMHPWHGAKKEAVIEHFAKRAGLGEAECAAKVAVTSKTFVESIEEAYFSETAPIGPINDRLMSWFSRLRAAGIKIGLDTGYPQNIQQGLIKKLGFEAAVDSYISSYEVREGRPFPYMIHQLMERTGIEDVRRVGKVGDSCRDVEMGKKAGCGLVVGVLSGADSAEELLAAGADIVVDVITDLPAPKLAHPAS